MPRSYVGLDLLELCEGANAFEPRDLLPDLKRCLETHPHGKVHGLFGLRRTGKSVLMLQLASMEPERSAYVAVSERDSMLDVSEELWRLKRAGCRDFFLDEVTKSPDFTKFVDEIADSFAMMGCHVFMAGTDSLNFKLAAQKALGRMILFSTTRIPFGENRRLVPDLSMLDYARYGGILDRSSFFDEVVGGKNGEWRRKMAKEYTLSAIAENIQHSLENYDGPAAWRVHDLCRQREMASLINFCAHYDTHRLFMRSVNKEYASGDLGHMMSILRKSMSEDDPMQDTLDRNLIAEMHRKSLSILNLEERKLSLDQGFLDEIERILREIDVLQPVTRIICDADGNTVSRRENVFKQPAIRWGQFESLFDIVRGLYPQIPESLLAEAGKSTFGKTFEDAVFLEAIESLEGFDVVRFDLVDGGKKAEADIVAALPGKKGFWAFEIKSGNARKSSRHLEDASFVGSIEKMYGPMLGWNVIRPDAKKPREIDPDMFVLEMLPELSMAMRKMAEGKRMGSRLVDLP